MSSSYQIPPTTTTTTTNRNDNDLQNSGMSSQTAETGSISEDEGYGWLGGIGSDFKMLANSFKESMSPAIGDLADFVHRTALSVAAEINKLEAEEQYEESNYDTNDQDKADYNNRGQSYGNKEFAAKSSSNKFFGNQSSLHLPWEIQCGTKCMYKEDENLKEKILALSCEESTFLKPFSTAMPASLSTDSASISSLSPKSSTDGNRNDFFVLDESRVVLIQNLLKIDQNLSSIHAKLSDQSEEAETVFWRNYFHHCDQIRRIHKQKSPLFQNADQLDQNVIDENSDAALHQNVVNEEIPSAADEPLSQNDPDGDSLVSLPDDDTASYVNIASAPCSLDSVEDLILVNKKSHAK